MDLEAGTRPVGSRRAELLAALSMAIDLERIVTAVGDFADLKCPFTLGHSRGVAALTGQAAYQSGLCEATAAQVRRAGHLHDLGRLGVWPDGLTTREVEMLRLLALARSNREIAEELVLSEKTVRNHVEHIYAKIGVTNRVGAGPYAVHAGLTREFPHPAG